MTNTANSACRPGLRAKLLALAALLAILGAVPRRGAEASRPGTGNRCSGADCAAAPARGVTVYRGLVLDYEVIDGMAVHGGDIVLGTAEEAAAATVREPAERERSGALARRDAVAGTSGDRRLWPGGRIPYVLDDGIKGEALETLQRAIEEWNSKTVISLFPRTDEPEYAFFRNAGCSSALGRGSPAYIDAVCGFFGGIHEIGHLVGLLHEDTHTDGHKFIAYAPRFAPTYRWYGRWVFGPFDISSSQLFRPTRPTAHSIPPGIGDRFIGGTGIASYISTGDIDGVARMYGMHPVTTTVSTHPQGLEVIVDGVSVTTPAAFDWSPGSIHTLEAPLLHRGFSAPLVFGSWSDGDARKHTVRAGPGTTMFQANYINQYKPPISIFPADAGTIAFNPPSPDGYYHREQMVEVIPTPAEGTQYEPTGVSLVGALYQEYTQLSQGPIFHSRPGINSVEVQHFGEPPFLRISSNIEGLRLPIFLSVSRGFYRSGWTFTPLRVPLSELGTVRAEVDVGWNDVSGDDGAVYYDNQSLRSGGRYRFIGWSIDGGEPEERVANRWINVPEGSESLTFHVQQEFSLYTIADGGRIVASPESADGYYPAGSLVQLTAVPYSSGEEDLRGWELLGWEHDLSGTEQTQYITMDRDRIVGAQFYSDRAPEPVMVQIGEPLQVNSLDGRHFVRLPPGTSGVTVRFESPVESPATMRDAEFSVTDWTDNILKSIYVGKGDTITINRGSLFLTRLTRNLTYTYSPLIQIRKLDNPEWSGTLHVSIQRDAIGGFWPQAFTFISPDGWSQPMRQTLRIGPAQGEIPHVRYRIVSDQPWLEAFPREWTSAQGDVEIAVSANPAALASEAYGGTLKILTVSDGDPPTGGTPTGIEIPVHFVVKPADDAEEPPGDESSGVTGGDDHGDTRGAATEIAAGSAARGRLERIGDEDWFRFRTTAAHTWVTAYTAPQGETLVELYVDGSDSPIADADSGRGTNIRLRAAVPAGTHYVRVRVSGYGTPDYTLMLEAVPDDHSNTKESATEIAVGASAQGRLEPDSDEDWFQFRTTAARTWVKAYTARRGDTLVELYVGGVTPVAPQKLDSRNFGSTAGVPAGTHYVRVSGSEFGTPDYTLTLKETLDEIEFVRIPAGSFVMGSPEYERGRRSDEGQHRVQITQAFWMGKFEVTQAEWAALMGSDVDCALCAVERDSWEEVQEFIRRLNERESGKGYRYRLPTEAEWEYAARAGATGARHGELIDSCSSNPSVQPVGQKQANAWGLHDMVGNAWEWTADWYGDYPTSWVNDPQGPSTGSFRVFRGGAHRCRFAFRGSRAYNSSVGVGFRLVRTPAGGSSGLAGGDDHGDTQGTATEVAVGASARGRVERVGDADWFRFQTTAARTLVAAYTVSEGETAGELHIAGGGTVTHDGSNNGGNFSIVADVPAGTHYLRVTGFGTADYTLTLEDTLEDTFVWIPAGTFVMGSPKDEDGHRELFEGQHQVQLSQAFWMGKFEVTQREWEAVMGENPSHFDCARCPVETVSWVDVQEFIRRLNERESGSGYVYRLPTEAEWEYAARAGTTGARYGELDEIAWYRDNSGGTTHPVGQKRANAWGLHDMLGNVSEWVGNQLYEYPSGPVTDPPQGPTVDGRHMMRGGAFDLIARFIRSAYRDYQSPHWDSRSWGFRLVRTE